jgi:hypothetical protein
MIDQLVATEQATKSIKAVVIDDAFDNIYASEVLIDNYRAFYIEANEDGAFDLVLSKLKIELPALYEWDDDSSEYENHLRELWKFHDNLELRSLIHHPLLFSRRLDNIDELKQLCKNLENQHFQIKELDSVVEDLTIFENNEYVYVFIDYNLGVHDGDQAVENAQRIAKKIYEACPEDKKPITILMSSDSRDETLIEKFQEEAGWVEGVFRFSPKRDLSNPEKVSLLIRAYHEEFLSNNLLQSYIDSLILASKNAQEAFGKEVKRLRVEDYEYIYSSILRDSQQPLGDYLAWLYGAHWGNLLLKSDGLKQKQDFLDQIITDKKPLHHSPPSKNISQIFMTALYEEGFDTLAHKWYLNNEDLPSKPHLHLGDLFTSPNSKQVYMILNPQCDLERPSSIDKDMSIFVIPGILDSIENQIDNDKLKTEFFIFEGKQFRIYWNIKLVKTITYSTFIDWVKQDRLSREHRLRLPFALEVQRRFTSNLSRVGLPVSPPLHGTLTISVGYRNFNNEIVRDFLPPKQNYGFFPILDLSRYDKDSKEKDQYRLTLQFALDFKDALMKEINDLLPIHGQENISEKQSKFLLKLQKFAGKFDDWFFNKKAFPKPKKLDEFTIIENDMLSSAFSSVNLKNLKTIFWVEVVVPEITEKNPEISDMVENKCTS